MTDQKPESEREGAPNGEFPQGPASGSAAAEAAAGEPDPRTVIETLSAENATLKDKLLRALAEMENLRRRTEREIADARTYGVTSLARDMLSLADNLRRALDSLPAETRASAEGPMKAFVEGVELTERDFLATLGRFGVKKLDPLGQKFDPNLHQAMFEMPDESVPAGTVTQVVQSGYTIGDRILRPALVGVAKGGPKPAVAAEPATASDEGASR